MTCINPIKKGLAFKLSKVLLTYSVVLIVK